MRFSSPSAFDSPLTSERFLTVRETAKLLGVCLDTVRRHLRSGKLPGGRVGRDWRVPERVVLAKMGLLDLDQEAEGQEATDQSDTDQNGADVVASDEKLVRPEDAITRQQIRALVQQAAQHADLSRRATQRLLAELDDLLQT